MTAQQRDELRRLQDDFLAAPIIRMFARLYGLHAPLWPDGPSYLDVKNKPLPEHRGIYENILRAEGHAPLTAVAS